MPFRTEAQKLASMRNWQVRNLRALQTQAYRLSPDRRARVIEIVDEELIGMGAKPYHEHHKKLRELDLEYDRD